MMEVVLVLAGVLVIVVDVVVGVSVVETVVLGAVTGVSVVELVVVVVVVVLWCNTFVSHQFRMCAHPNSVVLSTAAATSGSLCNRFMSSSP